MQADRRHFLAGGMIAGSATLVGSRSAIADAKPIAVVQDPSPLEIEAPPPRLAYPGRIAKVQTVDLWYWDTGGPADHAVVLLHPGTGSGEVWGYQAVAFAAAGYRVIGYSRRGFAGSTSGDPAKPGTAVDDLRMLLDYLKISRCNILGTAAGGFIAASFVVSWPERVKSLILACSLLTPADGTIGSLVSSLRGPWYDSLPHDFRELSPSYRMINKPGLARWNEFHSRSRGDNVRVDQPIGKVATLDALARLSMPVLLIAGDADIISPPPVARVFHRAMPKSELTVIPECGHSAYWERPRLFNSAVLGFLDRHSGRAARTS